MKLTPVLFTENIEESLPFWIDRLGFTKVAEVPDGACLGFAILIKNELEIMLQTWKSAAADIPSVIGENGKHASGTALFIEVEDFDDIRTRLAGAHIILPERVTFYGMREIGARAPSGHDVIFAIKETSGES